MIGADPGDVWSWTNDAAAEPPVAEVTLSRVSVGIGVRIGMWLIAIGGLARGV